MKKISSLFALLALLGAGCNRTSTTDIEETGQQVGDVMASVDESGGNTSGQFTFLEGSPREIERLLPFSAPDWLRRKMIPESYAASCGIGTFGSCTGSAVTRTFSGCSIGSATLDGTVTLTFAQADCKVDATNETVTRVPAFTITGRRGATLTVSKSGSVGQTITKTAGGYSFANDGIRRVFDGALTSFDFTTTTTTALTFTGGTRATRVLTGGTLRVTNNSANTYCDFTPSSVTWTSTCSCATSGSWGGTCSDGKTSTLTITGCGTGTLTVGSDSSSVTLDRCYGI